ncbi:MAG: DUF420 domain-containing protein [Planctomycetes bacterium]|nr:DUF420 domain-containing protein [Planctomycetota bacterium]
MSDAAALQRGVRLGMAGVGGVAVAIGLLLAAAGAAARAGPLPPELPGVLPPFTFQERGGRTVRAEDLRGSSWIADFIFTRCGGPCPRLTGEMARLQRELPGSVRLVTFTVDPEHDTPEVLARYAEFAGANPERWLFLSGPKAELHRLIGEGFHLTAEDQPADPENPFLHDTRFVLVDDSGRIRGYYLVDDPEALARLRSDARRLELSRQGWIPFTVFPPLNAGLNATCAVLLVLGWTFVRRKRVEQHVACMVTAFGTSVLFLACYLYYHWHHGATPFPGTGLLRTVYLSVLLTHTLLAAAVPVLAVLTLVRALRGQFERHARIARWTLPIWLYVSVTGVVVYWMLYHELRMGI